MQVIGDVAVFGEDNNRKRQLQLTGPVRLLLLEQFDALAFLEQIDVDTEKLWDQIDRLRDLFVDGVAARLDHENLRRSVDHFRGAAQTDPMLNPTNP